MLTLFHNRQQQQQQTIQQLLQWTKWSLCVFPARAGDTKISSKWAQGSLLFMVYKFNRIVNLVARFIKIRYLCLPYSIFGMIIHISWLLLKILPAIKPPLKIMFPGLILRTIWLVKILWGTWTRAGILTLRSSRLSSSIRFLISGSFSKTLMTCRRYRSYSKPVSS